ncbi:MAG: AAA family ATPase [Sandaracinaceae bacterium]
MTDPNPQEAVPAHSAQRQLAALSRFARFFSELEETFLEREDVLNQLALALLAREHVLITGPPGTGKSRLAASVVARIVHAESGQPSLFAKQFTESTVQTELIGPVDFRTLTETGRTEHFTDEGMLGAVHAFLDEVLDGRDMLLRSTLNILEERELKQGTRITPGLIECAVMTSNRYLTEVLEDSRQNLLAFVDRIAFVAFVPRGFADAAHLERIVESTLGDGIQLDARLTVEDVDVLQDMVERVRVPAGVVRQVVALTKDFEERAAQRERGDPSFTATRYFSTRAVARLARLLKAIVLLDKATRRPDRALLAEQSDLGMLRLAIMLAGPRPDDIEALLAHENDPRERRQLQIMSAELELFRDCLRALPPEEAPTSEEDSIEVGADTTDAVPAAASASESAEAPEESPAGPRGPSAERRLSQIVTALTRRPGDLDIIEEVLTASQALEASRPDGVAAARSARGHALTALGDVLRFQSPSSYNPTIEAVARHLGTLERAASLREALLAAEVAHVDRSAESASFAVALSAVVEHAATVFDRLAHHAVQDRCPAAACHASKSSWTRSGPRSMSCGASTGG